MPSRLQFGLVGAFQKSSRSQLSYQSRRCLSQRLYSTASNDGPPPPPPYLQKLKSSLKDAMRAKDQARLSVLRAIMSANLNASKTAKPIATDAQLVTMLMGMRRTIDQNIAEAKKVGRDDILQSEQVQAGILDEYIGSSGLEILGEAELRPLILKEIEDALASGESTKSLIGGVMKRVKEATEGKIVDSTVLAPLAKQLVNEQTKKS